MSTAHASFTEHEQHSLVAHHELENTQTHPPEVESEQLTYFDDQWPPNLSRHGDITPTLQTFQDALGIHLNVKQEDEGENRDANGELVSDTDMEDIGTESSMTSSPPLSSTTWTTLEDREISWPPAVDNWTFDDMPQQANVNGRKLSDDLLSHDLFYPNASSPLNPIGCATCGTRFDTYVQIEQHGKATRHLPFMCPFPMCVKMLARRDTLKRHLAAHKQPPQIACEACAELNVDKRFKRKDHLVQHVRRCHPEHVVVNTEEREKDVLKGLVRSLRTVVHDDLTKLELMEAHLDTLHPTATQVLLQDIVRRIEEVAWPSSETM